jgi:nicotinamidase-related amidase
MPGDESKTALLIVDMLSAYDHEDAEQLVESAARAVPVIAELRSRAQDAGVRVIYVNDNYGDWNSSASELADRARGGRHPELVEPLLPVGGDSFVIKLRHSVFYGTPLEHLIRDQGIERLILAGQVTEQCILYSAAEAYFRDFEVVVPRDAVAHLDDELGEAALRMIASNMAGEVGPAAECLR